MISLHLMIPYCFDLTGKNHILYGLIGIVASTAGFLAGLYQFRSWLSNLRFYRDRCKPSSHPHIIVCLSFANILACLGTVLLCISVLISYMGFGNTTLSHWNNWTIVSQILANFGYLSSCFWTFLYLLDVLLQFQNIRCMVEIYYLICWSCPLIFTVLFQCIRYEHGLSHTCNENKFQEMLASVWLVLILLFVFLDILVLMFITRQIKAQLFNMTNTFCAEQHEIYSHIRLKFVLIIAIFILCWSPTIISALIYLNNVDLAYQTHLWFPEVLLNPLQECFNCFLFTPRHFQPPETVSSCRYGSLSSVHYKEGSSETHLPIIGMLIPQPFQFGARSINIDSSSQILVHSQSSFPCPSLYLGHNESYTSSDGADLHWSSEESLHVGLTYGI